MGIDSTLHSPLSTLHSALRLANGVRAVLLPRPRSPTFALQLLVPVGSRHDGEHPGLAHLVEHLVFRAPGGPRIDLYEAVESLGGEVGGGTTRDYTCFEIVVAAPYAAQALALLASLVRAPATDPASFHAEQLVVCQELRERTAPAAALWDLLLAALWDRDPLVHAPGGTIDGVLALRPPLVEALYARWYHPPHLRVAAAGACSPETFAAAVEVSLGALPPGGEDRAAAPLAPPAPPSGQPRTLHATRPGPVVHLAVGLAVPGLDHPDCPALRLLDVALGHGASSRLADALAARGLRATVQSRYVPYAGVGVFAALAACAPHDAPTIAVALEEELRRLVNAPPNAEELAAAQNRYAGALYRCCESNLGLARVVGVEALFHAGDPPLTQTATRVAALHPEEVSHAARRHLADVPLARARVGPA